MYSRVRKSRPENDFPKHRPTISYSKVSKLQNITSDGDQNKSFGAVKIR